jgi:hypothetical protein
VALDPGRRRATRASGFEAVSGGVSRTILSRRVRRERPEHLLTLSGLPSVAGRVRSRLLGRYDWWAGSFATRVNG